MKKFLLVVLLSCPLFGADEFETVFKCHTPNIVDSGYQVTVESGGFAGMTLVIVESISFAGTTLIGKYVVHTSLENHQTIYQGKDIKLVVGQGEIPKIIGIPQKRYPAVFGLRSNEGKKHMSKLSCVSPLDPQ